MNTSLFRRKDAAQLEAEAKSSSLKRALGPVQLTFLGIGAIIGTGIFVLTGQAAAGIQGQLAAGPALTISFMITALACGFAALCYAEFASMIPISGSAYTYSYASFGELIAWIIGWDLILEYAVGNVAVAIGWSGYFNNLLAGFGLHLPMWMATDPGTAGHWIETGKATAADFPFSIGSLPFAINIPAVTITLLITALLVVGIQESARANAVLVTIKLGLIALFLIFGLPHVDFGTHWQEFAPNGFPGIMRGAALVFFAYIGFDAVSTTAEEAKNPQRDLPIGMIASLVICTILYIAVAAVLTGMVPLDILRNEKPIAAALTAVGENQVAFIIALGVTLTMPTVLLVMQLGQIRVFYSMSRDGLLPSRFERVHPKFRTPAQSTILVGLIIAAIAGFVDIGEAAELANIGTLFAFVLVAIGVWILRVQEPDRPRKFKVPAYQIICSLAVLTCVYLMLSLPAMTWIRFVVWMGIGMVVYFLYSKNHSKLNQ